MASTDSTSNGGNEHRPHVHQGWSVDRELLPIHSPVFTRPQFGDGMNLEIQDTDRELDMTVTDRIARHRNPISSFLVSLIFHTFLLVLLALMVAQFAQQSPPGIIAVLSDAPAPEVPDDELETLKLTVDAPEPTPVDSVADDVSVDNVLEAAANENISVAEPAESVSPAAVDALVETGTTLAASKGGGLKGRTSENRARLAARNGATAASEAAVEKGLRWLANHQDSSTGAWFLKHDQCSSCGGQCRNPGTIESQNAATGLSLLAFLGAGYTHESGRYQGNVRHGLAYLKSRIRKTKFGGSLVDDSMYAHGIATIALCEAYIMTGDESLREPIELAVEYIVSAQHLKGGWRYTPGAPGDMTVTGWQLMALKSAQMAGIEVPEKTLTRAMKFLDSLEESGGAYYGYQDPKKKPTTTAIGLLMRMYLGWPRDKGSLDTGADWLLSRGVSRRDIYYNYYATQVLHHLSVEGWHGWNEGLRDHLVATQADRGHEEGSWHFVDEHGSVGGRLYTTAMSIMVLEVYYRYLPLYGDGAVD